MRDSKNLPAPGTEVDVTPSQEAPHALTPYHAQRLIAVGTHGRHVIFLFAFNHRSAFFKSVAGDSFTNFRGKRK
jgi:hypothetical protein